MTGLADNVKKDRRDKLKSIRCARKRLIRRNLSAIIPERSARTNVGSGRNSGDLDSIRREIEDPREEIRSIGRGLQNVNVVINSPQAEAVQLSQTEPKSSEPEGNE